MEYFDNYDEKYPELILEIVDYFDEANDKFVGTREKSVRGFCEVYSHNGIYVYNPIVIDRICRKLCDFNIISCIKLDINLGMKSNYICFLKDRNVLISNKKQISYKLNSMVYGFTYIYKMCKNWVMPLVTIKNDLDYSLGTGFKYRGGIVTAKHCIEDVDNLQIKGYTAEELNEAEIYYSKNPGVDLAFIDLQRYEEPMLLDEAGEVMQEVLVVGYPKIPGFTNFLTAEKATISSKAILRITPTVGSIAAYGNEFLARMETMLITAKIRGGNSGGPVINSKGNLVGIACQVPNFEGKIGNYDDLGYGIAVPIKYLAEIVNGNNIRKNLSTNFFRDFVEAD